MGKNEMLPRLIGPTPLLNSEEGETAEACFL